MNYFFNQKLKYSNSIFLIILAYIFQTSLEEVAPYIIYQTDNTNPRPLLLDNGDVMAFSGHPAMMSRYNSNAEVIYSGRYINKTNNFNYDLNANIRQFSNDPVTTKIRFVLTSGSNTQLTIYLFNEDDGIVASSTFEKKVISYKIDIYTLNDNKILISYVSEETGTNENNENYIYKLVNVNIFEYNEDTKDFTTINHINKTTDNLFISCTQVLSNGRIVCQYVDNGCEEKSFNFIENQENIVEFDIEVKGDNPITECGYDKVINLNNDYVVFTYMNSKKVKFKIYQVKEDGTGNYITDNINKEKLGNEKCKISAHHIDSVRINDNSFVISCTGKDDLAYVDYETLGSDNSLTSKLFFSSTKKVNFPFISLFKGNLLSIFYNINGTINVFEIIEYPICTDSSSLTIYINSNTDTFSLNNNIVVGTIEEDSSEILEVYFPDDILNGDLYLINSDTTKTKVQSGSLFNYNSEFYFESNYFYGLISINYAGKRGNNIGNSCSMIIQVLNCYEGCKSCDNMGTSNNEMLCKGCNKEMHFYPNENDAEKEINGNEAINCYNELNHEGYYLDGEVFKSCWETCKHCSGTGNAVTHLCKECIAGYVPVINDNFEENEPFNCVLQGSSLEGYYSNGTHYLQCYISCKTCSSHGDGTHNNCTSCDITNGYYSFEDNAELNGQCSRTDYPGNHYLYIPGEGSTDESMWKLCYTTCATCSQGGIVSENNCETCIDGYYKIEGDTKGTCTNETPEQ